MKYRTKERPSEKDRERTNMTPEVLMRILLRMYPEEIAFELFEKLTGEEHDKP